MANPCAMFCPEPEDDRANQYKVDEGADNRAPDAPNAMDGMGGMGGMMGAAGGMGMMGGLMGMMSGGSAPPPPNPNNPAEFRERAAQALPATVHMFSGCRDEQTSADVHNVASFGLPPDSGPGGAGGACTNAMMKALLENPNPTWTELLERMRQILKEKNFTQVPQLSSSKEIQLNDRFNLTPSGGPTKALFIGINYVGQQGELNGCHNDVIQMKQFVTNSGFDEGNMLVLMDDGAHKNPGRDNILNGIRWLVQDAKAGDNLFMHYSGHGGSMPDDNGDEADGMDETMVPVDYQDLGQIRDDLIFQELVSQLPEGVKLTVVMDCCHSGSILDLPFSFQANDTNSANGYPSTLPANGNFDWNKAFKVGMQLFQMYQRGASTSQMMQVGMQMFR